MSQIAGEVGLEVWIMNKFIKSVKATRPRASFASTPAPAERTPEAQAVREPEFASLKTNLAEITVEQARAFLEEVRCLPCAQATVVEWSPELTHATCSNTAPYHLGAGKTALAAMFYLVKYLKKEAGSPNPPWQFQLMRETTSMNTGHKVPMQTLRSISLGIF